MYCMSLLVFLDKGYSFNHLSVLFNGCYDVLMMSVNIDNNAILNSHDVDYRCIFVEISKIEAIDFFKNADLKEDFGSS